MPDRNLTLPPDFVATVAATFENGAAWLRTLPGLLDECTARYGLTIGPPFDLSYNYVAPAVLADGTQVVLKLGVPNPELTTEILALERYGGDGAARLLASDPDRGMLLLERLQPGTMLAALKDDEQATEIAGTLMRRLWQPVAGEHPFHTVVDWGSRGMGQLRATFGGGVGPFTPRLVELAEAQFGEAASSANNVLLHGDLHHENILAATREPWLVIDPKGIVGPRGYECGTYLRNQLLNKADPARALARRVAQLAEILELERDEILRWGVAHNVLSAWWSFEARGIVASDGLICAELCARALPATSSGGG
jgi:streptomycin 6-kinase